MQNGALPVAIFIMVQETFLYDCSRYTLAPIFGEIGPRETCRLRSRWRCWAILPRPFWNTPEYVHFHKLSAKFRNFLSMLKPSKSPLLSLGKKIIIVILTISIGPLTIRCSGSNNNYYYDNDADNNIKYNSYPLRVTGELMPLSADIGRETENTLDM